MEENPDKDKSEHKKRFKKRKRHIYNSIRQQMEFYFGDSNLQKDRFMKKLIGQDEYVPLEVFLTFNRIKSMADSVEKIAKALTESELLELDEAKTKVRRKTPFSPDENVDDRTIYVEALPANVDHDWLTNMFKRFGKVTYVSLPKHAISRKPKNFGFVEFENEKSVESAVKLFEAFNGVLCKKTTDPAKLASIISHKSKTETEEMEIDKKATKRPMSMPTVEGVNSKRPKLDEADANSESVEEKESSAGVSDENETDIKEDATEIKKRRRKHKKTAEKRKKQLELTTDASFYELKILEKREWKRLRNRYLNLQRVKTSEIKRAAAKERQQKLAKESANANVMTDVGSCQVVGKKSKNEERRMHKMKMNFYGAVDAAEAQALNKNSKNNKADNKVSMKFERGLIVEVNFDKPCVDVKEFKVEMKQNKSMKYVDVMEGAMVAFLRLETPAAAEDFIKNTTNAERQHKLLNGEAEIAYFEKIERDRQSKLNKEIKVPSKRGREKVKATLAKHIFFNDDNVE